MSYVIMSFSKRISPITKKQSTSVWFHLLPYIYSICFLYTTKPCGFCIVHILIYDPWFQDVATKIMSLAGNGWAVCILSSQGAVSSVTLRQGASSGDTVIYEVWSIVLASNIYTWNPYCLINYGNFYHGCNQNFDGEKNDMLVLVWEMI
jgi:hypothetical protein